MAEENEELENSQVIEKPEDTEVTDKADSEDTGVTDPETPPSDNPENTPEDENNEPEVIPIELIVESGSCNESANSYVDLEFADKYNRERARSSWLSLDEETKKRCLILGTDYIDHYYKWHGRKATQKQSLSFPRVNLVDADGFCITGIPLNLKKAVVEAAYLNIDSETLFETEDENGSVKREKIDVLETEYFGKGKDSKFSSIYTVLNSLLAGLFRTEEDQATFNVGAIWLNEV